MCVHSTDWAVWLWSHGAVKHCLHNALTATQPNLYCLHTQSLLEKFRDQWHRSQASLHSAYIRDVHHVSLLLQNQPGLFCRQGTSPASPTCMLSQQGHTPQDCLTCKAQHCSMHCCLCVCLSVCGSECMLGLVVQLGNFSYTVSMHAEPAEAETVPQLQACLGSTARHVLTLHNPVGTETLLQTSCSNPHNFTLSSPTVVLPPYGQTEVSIDYLPSSLGELTHHCHNVQQGV